MASKSLITVNEHPLSKKDFMESVEQEIIYLHDTGDIQHVMNVLSGLEDVEGVTGHMKARLLWASQEWFKQNCPDQSFTDHVESTAGLKKVTVDRYLTVQRYIENYTIPKEIAERPMRELVPIAKTLAQGYDISKDQWRKIKNTTSDAELREVLQKVKGKQPRKSARVIKLTRDGTLFGYKNDVRYFIGSLNIRDAQDDQVLAEFIQLIKDKVGILEE